MDVNVRIDRETRDRLRLYAAKLSMKTGKVYSYSDAVDHLLALAEHREENLFAPNWR